MLLELNMLNGKPFKGKPKKYRADKPLQGVTQVSRRHMGRGFYSEKDPTRFGEWTFRRYLSVILLFSIPYLFIVFVLYFNDLHLLSLILLCAIGLLGFFAWYLRNRL